MTVLGKHFLDVAEALVKYQERGFLCDAVLVAKCGGEVRAHAALLAAVSPIFLNALEAVPFGGPHHLYFPEVELEVLQIAVQFIYTGKLSLPTLFSQMDQLSMLLNKLSDLGLDLQKLHGCEMTFVRKTKPAPVLKSSDNATAGLEHNYHKTDLRDATRKRKPGVLESNPGDRRSSAPNGNVTVIDLTAADGKTIPATSCGDSGTVNSNTFDLNSIIDGVVQTKTCSKKAPVSLLKPLSRKRPTDGTASDVKGTASSLVKSNVDQSGEQVFILGSDNPGFWDVVMGESDDVNAKQDVFQLIDASAEEQSEINLGLDGEGQPMHFDGLSEVTTLYVCDFCDENDRMEFSSEFELSWHKIKFHWERCHQCSVCDRKFSTEASLKNHFKRHFGFRPRQKSRNYKCDECTLRFDSMVKLKAHKSRHTGEKPYECKDCGKRFTQPCNLERHQMLHSGYRPFLCDFCGKGFVQKWSLMEHVSVHHEDSQEFECALCSCKLKNKEEMEKHALEVHQLSQLVELTSMIKKPETHLCDLCGRNFISATSLRHHLKGHGNKPARCETCGKKFSTFYGLQLHMKLHTGERPFVCDICQKGFIQKTSLMTHLATHSGIKPFACVVCSKAFTSKGQLKQHMLMHSGEKPYKCGVCNKQFTYKSSLTLHNRTHTGDKPYKCTTCGTSYTQMHHLRGHLRTHTGEKPFVCEICGKSYKNKIDLRYHYTRFHKVDVKRVVLNMRSEYIFDLDQKADVAEDMTEENSASSTLEEFTICELKPEICK